MNATEQATRAQLAEVARWLTEAAARFPHAVEVGVPHQLVSLALALRDQGAEDAGPLADLLTGPHSHIRNEETVVALERLMPLLAAFTTPSASGAAPGMTGGRGPGDLCGF